MERIAELRPGRHTLLVTAVRRDDREDEGRIEPHSFPQNTRPHPEKTGVGRGPPLPHTNLNPALGPDQRLEFEACPPHSEPDPKRKRQDDTEPC